MFEMHLFAESVYAENICAHPQESGEQRSFGPTSAIELLTPLSSTAFHASLLVPAPQST